MRPTSRSTVTPRVDRVPGDSRTRWNAFGVDQDEPFGLVGGAVFRARSSACVQDRGGVVTPGGVEASPRDRIDLQINGRIAGSVTVDVVDPDL